MNSNVIPLSGPFGQVQVVGDVNGNETSVQFEVIKTDRGDVAVIKGLVVFGLFHNVSDAEMAAACLNACAEIPIEDLKSCGKTILQYMEDQYADKISALARQRDELLLALKDLLENVSGIVPDKNCSCHIAPPCNDCVEWGALRESIALANYTIAKAGGAV